MTDRIHEIVGTDGSGFRTTRLTDGSGIRTTLAPTPRVKLHPLPGQVVIRAAEQGELVSQGGIVLPHRDCPTKQSEGEVVALGPPRPYTLEFSQDLQRAGIKPNMAERHFKLGDRVIFKVAGSYEVERGDQHWFIVDDNNILARVELEAEA